MKTDRKIWILTRRAGYNYGTTLQAYAMTRMIEKLGYANRIIDYDEYSWRGRFRIQLLDTGYRFVRLCPVLFSRLYARGYRILCDSYRQRRMFDHFEKLYLPLTGRTYRSSAAIQADASDCDVLVCGSDQIWSPVYFDPTFFLDFANHRRTRTIAYAPSIGVTRVDEHRDEMARLIGRIDHLSVREEQGARMIEGLIGRNAFVALDPTLALESHEWEQLAEKPMTDSPYILCYFLATDRVPVGFIGSLSRATGYRVVNIQSNYCRIEIPEAENIGHLSPTGFLGWVSQATYVCTNSFHGTIFSLHFRREFFVFERFAAGSPVNQNSRIQTLLTRTGLQNRLVEPVAGYDSHCPVIDYETVHARLSEQRNESIDYIRTALYDAAE